MFAAIKRLFREPSEQEHVREELRQARLALLDAHTQFEHAAATVGYYRVKIRRLESHIQGDSDE